MSVKIVPSPSVALSLLTLYVTLNVLNSANNLSFSQKSLHATTILSSIIPKMV